MLTEQKRRPLGTALVEAGSPADFQDQSIDVSTWAPISLVQAVRGLADGTLSKPAPSVGLLADGSYLLYPGRVSCIAGESGSGKSMTAVALAQSELNAGNRVVYIDFEDTPIGIVSRMRSAGISDEIIADPECFLYIQPEKHFGPQAQANFFCILAVV